MSFGRGRTLLRVPLVAGVALVLGACGAIQADADQGRDAGPLAADTATSADAETLISEEGVAKEGGTSDDPRSPDYNPALVTPEDYDRVHGGPTTEAEYEVVPPDWEASPPEVIANVAPERVAGAAEAASWLGSDVVRPSGEILAGEPETWVASSGEGGVDWTDVVTVYRDVIHKPSGRAFPVVQIEQQTLPQSQSSRCSRQTKHV
jgi:hypothetical protein